MTKRWKILDYLRKNGPESTYGIAQAMEMHLTDAKKLLEISQWRGLVKSRYVYRKLPQGGKVRARMWSITKEGEKWLERTPNY